MNYVLNAVVDVNKVDRTVRHNVDAGHKWTRSQFLQSYVDVHCPIWTIHYHGLVFVNICVTQSTGHDQF